MAVADVGDKVRSGEFMLYMDLAMPGAEETTKVKLFNYLLGERGRELLATLERTTARRTVSSMIALFDEHCNPKLNSPLSLPLTLLSKNNA